MSPAADVGIYDDEEEEEEEVEEEEEERWVSRDPAARRFHFAR